MSSNFKLYDPIEDAIARVNSGAGGGGIPATGGTFTGNVTMQQPAKIVQCEAPTGPCDLVNKGYIDALVGTNGPFLPLSGGAMTGQITQPLAPVAGTDLVNKSYADSLVIAGAPDATTVSKGIVQLAGDLSGTAAAPLIGANKITYAKMQQVGASSLLGNPTGAPSTAQEIVLGTGLTLSGNTLNAATASDATTTIKGVVQLAGDLSGTAASPLVGANKVTYAKIQQVAGAKKLLGSQTATTNVSEIGLGAGLDMVGNNLVLDSANAQKASASQFGVVEFDSVNGDLVEVTPGIAEVGLHKISYDKIQAVSAGKKILGAQTSGSDVLEIGLGAGLDMVGNNLVLDPSTAAKATDTTFGVIEFDPSGDLQTVNPGIARIRNNKVTYPKMQLVVGAKKLLGAQTSGTNVSEIGLGAGLDMVGNNLILDSTTAPKAGATQFGVVEFDAATGDLVETSGNSGIATVGSHKITYPKMQQVSGSKMLLGAQTAGTDVSEIGLGTGLDMIGNSIVLDLANAQKAGSAQFGVVEFDPSGDLSATAANSGIGVISPNKVSYAKMQQVVGAKKLLGSQTATTNVSEIGLGAGLDMTGSVISVNTATFPVLPVSKGGTGATTLTGYLVGNGTSPVTTVSSIPVASVTGAVGSVNGIFPVPSNGGNVVVPVGTVTTGILSAIPSQPQPNGDTYVVSGDPTPANNGRTFISDGTTWQEITSNLATTDARYVLKSGDTMSGNLSVPTGVKVLLTDLPTSGTDAANKNYVDSQIAASTAPDATTSSKGIVQLAGDLSGTAAAPLVGVNKVLYSKIQQVVGAKKLLGSQTATTNVAEIGLGAGLDMVGSNIVLDPANAQKAGATQFGVVEFDPSGDLSATAANSGIGVISPNKVSYAKMQQVVGAKKLLGSQTATTNVDEIGLGAGLDMLGNNIVLDPANAQKAGAAQFGVVEFDPSGDLSATAANSGIGIISPNKVLYSKIQQVVGAKKLLGSQTATTNVAEIGLGAGLDMVGSNIVLDPANAQKAGATQFGVVEFDPSGDLSATAANSGIGVISPNKVSYAKMQQVVGAKKLLGSQTATTNVAEIGLGAGLDMVGSNIVLDPANAQKAGAAQFGVVEFDAVNGDLIETGANSGIAKIKNVGVTNPKIAPGAASSLKGTNSLVAVDDIILGTGLSLTAGAGPTLSVNTTALSATFLPLAGGTMSGQITQPLSPSAANDLANKAYVDSQVALATTPDATTLLKGKVQLAGDLAGTAALPLVAPLAITNSKLANLSGTSQLKGSSSSSTAATDIVVGTGLTMSTNTLIVDNATLSTTFLPLSGGTMTGAISQPLLPSVANDLANKAYVDTQVASATIPDATTLVKGKVQLAGDLAGTAALPVIGNAKVTNPKIAPGAASTLKGTNSTTSVDDIILGAGLSLTSGAGPTLSVNSASLPKAGASQFGVVEFDTTVGDLIDVATNSGIALVKPQAIVNSKLANMTAVSQLKGSSSLSTTTTDISLGAGLTMIGSSLSVLGIGSYGAWSANVPITITGTTTNPTKSTTTDDYIRFRQVENKSYCVDILFAQSGVGTTGSGSYLFALPGALTFNASLHNYYTGAAGTYNILLTATKSLSPLKIGLANSASCTMEGSILPYDSTHFRIFAPALAVFVGSASFHMAQAITYTITFTLETP